MDIVLRLLQLMEEKNINAAELSREISLTNGLISQWKSGKQKPSTDAIIKLAKYFNVTTDFLLLGVKEKCPIIDISNDEIQLLSNYNKLDHRGQCRVHTTIYEEIDRMENTKKEPATG